jgi:hypothetical protein
MKIDRIQYKKAFSLGNYSSEHIGLEGEVNEGEDLLNCFNELRELAHEIFKKHNPHLSEFQEPDIPVVNYGGVRVNPYSPPFVNKYDLEEEPQPPKERTEEEKMIDEIENLTDLKKLESYKILAKVYPAIKQAYDNQYKKLTA